MKELLLDHESRDFELRLHSQPGEAFVIVLDNETGEDVVFTTDTVAGAVRAALAWLGVDVDLP